MIFTVWTGPGSDEKHLQLQMIASGERRVLVHGASTGRYVPSGHIVYSRDDALFAVPFDLAQLRIAGTAMSMPEMALDDEGAHFSVSEAGLAYLPVNAGRFERRLVWVDAAGNIDPLPLPPRGYTDPVLSRDGRFIAVTLLSAIEAIWIYDLARHTLAPLTSTSAGSSQAAMWTPDGTRLLYRGTRAGFRNLFSQPTDGGGLEERLTTSEALQAPTSASPDGKYVTFVDTTAGSGPDIAILQMDGRETRPFLQTPSVETGPRFAPDGRWIAYSSDESGASEVYIRPFPGPGGKLQVSLAGGSEPVWSKDGQELYYRNGDRMLAGTTHDAADTHGNGASNSVRRPLPADGYRRRRIRRVSDRPIPDGAAGGSRGTADTHQHRAELARDVDASASQISSCRANGNKRERQRCRRNRSHSVTVSRARSRPRLRARSADMSKALSCAKRW